MASKTTLNWGSYLFSRASSLWASSAWEERIFRKLTNVLMISILTWIALRLFKTLDNIATPSWVRAYGGYLRLPLPLLRFEVPICDLKEANSSLPNWNMKSEGNRSIFRLTAWINTWVGTP